MLHLRNDFLCYFFVLSCLFKHKKVTEINIFIIKDVRIVCVWMNFAIQLVSRIKKKGLPF